MESWDYMSFLSIFRRKKNNKTELNEKKLLSQDDVKLDDEVRLDFKEENVELNKCKKITDEKLIEYIVSILTVTRPENSKFTWTKLEENGFALMPEWDDALGRYIEEFNESTEGKLLALKRGNNE